MCKTFPDFVIKVLCFLTTINLTFKFQLMVHEKLSWRNCKCPVDLWQPGQIVLKKFHPSKNPEYETHKHYIAGSLKPWSPSASWDRGVSMGGPIALWTKDYNGFCDVSCSPLQRLAWLKVVSHNREVLLHVKRERVRVTSDSGAQIATRHVRVH